MIVQTGDILTLKKRWRVEVTNSCDRTVLITDMDTKKSEFFSFEMIQGLDTMLTFDVSKSKVKNE